MDRESGNHEETKGNGAPVSGEGGNVEESSQAKFADPVTVLRERINADILVYNGPIDYPSFFDLLDYTKQQKKHPNVVLLLSTFGGDPDAAYRIARCLKSTYERISVLIGGICKSAGTLVALAADEIVMASSGELGPLDIQLRKRDEIFEMTSGLDATSSLDVLREKSLQSFRRFMMDVCGGARLSARTAASIATELTTGLFGKLYEQIDPVHLAETTRANSIAMHYGRRLSGNLQEDALRKLVYDYPAHGYVIDLEEAKKLFKNVRQPTEIEESLIESVEQNAHIRIPRDEDDGTLILILEPPRDEAVRNAKSE